MGRPRRLRRPTRCGTSHVGGRAISQSQFFPVWLRCPILAGVSRFGWDVPAVGHPTLKRADTHAKWSVPVPCGTSRVHARVGGLSPSLGSCPEFCCGYDAGPPAAAAGRDPQPHPGTGGGARGTGTVQGVRFARSVECGVERTRNRTPHVSFHSRPPTLQHTQPHPP